MVVCLVPKVGENQLLYVHFSVQLINILMVKSQCKTNNCYSFPLQLMLTKHMH